jgi:N-acetylmuramoyl-L-alanine amidase
MSSRLRVCGCLLATMVPVGLVAAMPRLVAIDVGHSKAHPGATSARGQVEFQFNQALAQSIYEGFSAKKIAAVQIGHKGTLLHLTDRTSAAEKAGATFFLSVHHDSVQPHYLKSWQWQGKTQQYSDQFSGFSLFVSRKNPQFTASLQCASRIGAALKQKGLQPSPHHAEAIEGEAKTWADQDNGVYYYDNLVVLKTATVPAVLLEAGVLVNREEELKLQTTDLRHAITEAVAQGLQHCHH